MPLLNIFTLIFTIWLNELFQCATVEMKNYNQTKDIQGHQINAGIIASIVDSTITSGASLTGTTVNKMIPVKYNTAASGTVENKSKWELKHHTCSTGSGKIDKSIISVQSGLKEGFSSHKTGHTAKGTWVSCKFTFGKNKYFYYMYSVSDDKLQDNTLALYVCDRSDCPDVSTNDMYNKDLGKGYEKKTYRGTLEPVRVCGITACAQGWMGSSNKPTIVIKFYPIHFDDASDQIKETFKNFGLGQEDYASFINGEFSGSTKAWVGGSRYGKRK